MVLMASAQYTTPQPRAGAMYIIEAANATFVNANTLVMNGASGSTAFKWAPVLLVSSCICKQRGTCPWMDAPAL